MNFSSLYNKFFNLINLVKVSNNVTAVNLASSMFNYIAHFPATSFIEWPFVKKSLTRIRPSTHFIIIALIVESQLIVIPFICFLLSEDFSVSAFLVNVTYKIFNLDFLYLNWLFIFFFQIIYLLAFISYNPAFLINSVDDLTNVFLDNHYTFLYYYNAISDLLHNSSVPSIWFVRSQFFFTFNLILINLFNFLSNFLFAYPLFFYFGLLFLCSTIISLFFVSYLGLYGVFYINIISLFCFWFSTFLSFSEIIYMNKVYRINLGKWFYLFFEHPVFFEFYVDSLSITYILLTLTISFFVQLYTFSYFRYEPLVERLIIFLNLFIISMIFLVSSSNIIMLFLGWELIGLTSFVLINFWVTRKATLKAAFKAFVFNKFSDISFFMFVILIYFNFFETDIEVINSQAYSLIPFTFDVVGFEISMIEIISMFIILAAFIKSAQFGGHLWLPDSMEAPVPASALIHSATLVSAGLFLLLRFNVFFELSNYVYYIIPFIGSLTSFYGGLSAAYQSDIKRILAYSTISHCGFLMVSFSSYLYDFTLLYLYIHGFFKAGVFLCVGNVIRFSKNYQDFKRMGGYSIFLPFECYLSSVGLLNLGGLPFSLGFYMKHLLLTSLLNSNIYYITIWMLCLFGALTGLFYSYKLYYYVFFDFLKSKKNTIYGPTRYNVVMDVTSSQFKPNVNYSNTSLASNIAISGLFFFAYILSLYVYLYIKNSNLFSWDLSFLYNSQYTDLFINNYNFLWNISYYNWLAFICLIGLFFSFFRKVYNHTYIYDFFFMSFIFFIFFLFFTILLS